MPIPQPPSLIWNRQVDAPLVQDASYRLTSVDRAYIDSQILGCETLILTALAQTSAWTSTVQSCSAGGTIASTATTGVGIIVLTGSPSAAFTYQLPTGAGAYQIVNNAGQYCTVTSSGSGAQLIQPAGNMFVSTDGTNVYSPVAPPSVQRYTTASSSKQILISVPGQPQSVSIDTSSGAVTCAAPVMANVTDGQVFECKDVTCYWGTNQAALTTESGISIENPQSLGTYIAHGTTLNLLKLNGSGNAWRAYKTESKWACIY
jgi:hypothetical protein